MNAPVYTHPKKYKINKPHTKHHQKKTNVNHFFYLTNPPTPVVVTVEHDTGLEAEGEEVEHEEFLMWCFLDVGMDWGVAVVVVGSMITFRVPVTFFQQQRIKKKE